MFEKAFPERSNMKAPRGFRGSPWSLFFAFVWGYGHSLDKKGGDERQKEYKIQRNNKRASHLMFQKHFH
jgi:hypothetical protein